MHKLHLHNNLTDGSIAIKTFKYKFQSEQNKTTEANLNGSPFQLNEFIQFGENLHASTALMYTEPVSFHTK